MKFDLEKRIRELFGEHYYGSGAVVAMIAREALAAQAEEIAEWCEFEVLQEKRWGTGGGFEYDRCARFVRSLISKPEPEKTREQELEDGIRAFVNQRACTCAGSVDFACPTCRFRRLLEKKP